MNLNKIAMVYFLRESYALKSKLFLVLCLFVGLFYGVSTAYSQSSIKENILKVNGKISTEAGAPLMNADIHIKNTFIATQSDEDGEFEIDLMAGDVLVVSAFLMKTSEITVRSGDYISINLAANAELLDDILLSQKKKQEERVSTPFQNVKSDSRGFPKQSLLNKDFWPGDISVYESLVRNPLLSGRPGGGLSFQRSRGQINPSPALVILDDVPVDQSVLQQLDPDQVQSVSMVRSLAGSIKYGSLGAGGVIYVKTKNTFNFDDNEGGKSRSALATDNEYSENLLSIEESFEDSSYIAQLKSAQSFEQAKDIYDQHTVSLGVSSLLYYLEASDFFTQWDPLYSHHILSQLFRLSNNNPKVLLGIAYQCEQLGRHRQAAYVYQELMLMRPDHVQSYLDLAQVYTQIGNYKLASSLYRQMLYNTIPNLDFRPIEFQIITEYRRFLSKFRSKVKFQGLPNELLIPNSRKTVRIVFEWTNPLTEFELQFVSPDKKFYNWRHSAFDNKGFIESELASGFSTKDFVIENAARGDWIININRLSEDNENIPTFVKYTIYKNYGLQNETTETKIVPLNKVDMKVTLDAISG
ncbi:MAG: TonB-dependent receptor plug domain-containing protein [Flavobacteriaceae bacterium]|nr:TonB-dependent receptor plug domain-containing protein [Flavobacteriaceae bacterium]NNK53054.1 TonB-dependent receptor plug domain-containing protein [Flavobacteriaceae bacterium]